MVSVYISFQNKVIKVMLSNKCYDSFENIAVKNLQ